MIKKTALFDRLKALNPERNVTFTAIEQLSEPEEMRQFVDEYAQFIADKTGNSMAEARCMALMNIGYVIGYYSQETANRWLEASHEVSHPVFGRSIPYAEPSKAYNKGHATTKRRGQ